MGLIFDNHSMIFYFGLLPFRFEWLIGSFFFFIFWLHFFIFKGDEGTYRLTKWTQHSPQGGAQLILTPTFFEDVL